MSKVICKICGSEEESDKWITHTKEKIEEKQMCFNCLHWEEQYYLDCTERGKHGYAIVNGIHYTLHPHTDINWLRGMGGAKFKIKFFDRYETTCDNLWCQGEVPSLYWRERLPNNAEIIAQKNS